MYIDRHTDHMDTQSTCKSTNSTIRLILLPSLEEQDEDLLVGVHIY